MTTNDQPMDHVPPEEMAAESKSSSELEQNVKQKSTWVRLFFMIVFAFLYGLSRLVIGAVVVIQFFYVLLTGETKEQLKTFGHSLAIYSYEIIDYLTFNTDDKPFPFEGSWPTSLPRD
jgi:hypothetical protein